jgi:hypothetical protein
MNIAKQINNRLDDILAIRAEIRKMDAEITEEEILTNKSTGEKMNKKEVVGFIEKTIDDIKKDLNKITNNGSNVNGIFTNKFYVNDLLQDKEIAQNK